MSGLITTYLRIQAYLTPSCQAQDSQDILNLLELKGETHVSDLPEN